MGKKEIVIFDKRSQFLFGMKKLENFFFVIGCTLFILCLKKPAKSFYNTKFQISTQRTYENQIIYNALSEANISYIHRSL